MSDHRRDPDARVPVSAARMRIKIATAVHRRITRVLQDWQPEDHPRRWSNRQIRRVGEQTTGDVVHVSAWEDSDKEGGRYREYFPRARSYSTTNYGGARGATTAGDHSLDLERELPEDLQNAFDLVFNHTTLEHVFDLRTAMNNLFAMSRSDVLLVVPFMQVEHWEAPSYGDYWRVGAHGLVRSCVDNKFRVLSLTSNHNPVWPIYYCLHARRFTEANGSTDFWTAAGDAEGFGSRPVGPGHRLMS